MRIDKINDNQIRCFLSKEDMESRQLHLKELAYGTEKARALFHELLREARARFGFEVENMPVMVEAVPLQDDSLVLIVTKVDNPEELDTRFSNFAPSVQKDALPAQQPPSPLSQLLKSLRENGGGAESPANAEEALKARREYMMTSRLYSFDTMADVISAAKVIAPNLPGDSSLYRDEQSGKLFLLIRLQGMEELGSMQGSLAALSEYGKPERVSAARQQYLITHCTAVCKKNALETLSQL